MREFRCESEVIRKGYLLLSSQVSKAIELGVLDVYEPLQLVVIDDVVVHWYAGDPFKGKFKEPPHDELLRSLLETRYNYEKQFFEEHSINTLLELAVKRQRREVPIVRRVFTDREAATLWEVGLTAVTRACTPGPIAEHFTDDEFRESAGTYLISEDAMNRLFGERAALRDDMGIVFMKIGSEEAMLVRSRLLSKYSDNGEMNAFSAVRRRTDAAVRTAIEAIGAGRPEGAVSAIAELAVEAGIVSKVVPAATDFVHHNRVVWDYLRFLIDSDEVEVWRPEGELALTAEAAPINPDTLQGDMTYDELMDKVLDTDLSTLITKDDK